MDPDSRIGTAILEPSRLGYYADQTHHFSFYLSVGINRQRAVYLAGQTGVRPWFPLPRPDNEGDQRWVRRHTITADTCGDIHGRLERSDSGFGMYPRGKWSLLPLKTMITKTIPKVIAAVILCSMLFVGCQRENTLIVEKEMDVRFRTSGRGILDYFAVRGPDLEHPPKLFKDGPRLPALVVYWELIPSGSGRTLDDIGTIEYGKVPAGYTQAYPKQSASPPPLMETERYHVFLEAKTGRGFNRFFTIREGKIFAEGQD